MAIKLRTFIFAVVALALSAFAGFAVFNTIQNNLADKDAADFQKEASFIHDTAFGEAGLNGYLKSLISIRGLFSASISVERNEFQAFIEGSESGLLYPAASTFLYAKRVSRGDEASFIESVRKDSSVPNLDLSHFSITPAGERATYFPITYIEPKGLESELGNDLYTVDENHDAIQSAVDKNDVSSVIEFADSNTTISMFLPVFKNGVSLQSSAEKESALIGILNVRIDLCALFNSLFTNNPNVGNNTHITLQEINNAGKNVYELGPSVTGSNILTDSQEMRIKDVDWRVIISRPTSHNALNIYGPLMGGLGAGFLLLVLFGVFFSLIRSRERAKETMAALHKQIDEAEHERTEQSAVPTILFDVRGVITDANKSFCDLVELTKENILGKNINHLDSMPESSTSRLSSNFMYSISGEERPSFDIQLHTRSNRLLYLECHLSPEYSGTEVTHIKASFKDVAERVLAQKELLLKDAELSLNEKYLDNIIRGANVGTWDWQVQTGELKLNERWAEIVGYTLKELEPISIKTWEKVAYPEDLKKSDELLNEHFSHHSDFYALDCRVMHKNGSLIWVADRGRVIEWDAEGKPLRMTGIHMDITDLKTANEKLEKELIDVNKFKLSVDAVEDLVAITDADGIIQYVNHGAEKLTGFSSEELLGRKAGTKENWGGFMSSDYYETLWNTVKLKKLPFHGEINVKKKSGEHYIASAEIAPILDEHGTVKFFIDIHRDITKEKEVERAKTEFIALASHQLRTPLTAINWYSEMLLGGDLGPVNDKQKKYLDEINNGGKRLANLINALLNVSRVEMGFGSMQHQEINVDASLQTIIHDHEARIVSKQLKTNISIAPDLPKISIDKNLFEAMIQNIISNAIDYTDISGTVGVSAKKEGEYLTISVSDTGIGIPIQDKDRIFEKLYRAENATTIKPDGNGLGLYITKKFLDLIGGSISFISEEHKGSTFTVKIPITHTHKTPKLES